MTPQTDAPSIDVLLADRTRLESWLDQLAAKAGHVPSHVAQRVQDDYRARLDGIVTALAARADALRSEVAALTERVQDLDAQLAARRDALAEDELRALVGEYAEAEWQQRVATHNAAITAAAQERDLVEAERERLAAKLAEATRPADAASAVGVSDDLLREPPAPVTPAGAPIPSAVDDELLLVDIVDAAIAPLPSTISDLDEMAFLATMASPPSAGSAAAATIVPLEPEPELEPESDPEPVAAPEEALFAGSFIDALIPAELQPPSTTAPRTTAELVDASRSLKCQECGWMNVPTEWYCEKCGGELSAF